MLNVQLEIEIIIFQKEFFNNYSMKIKLKNVFNNFEMCNNNKNNIQKTNKNCL